MIILRQKEYSGDLTVMEPEIKKLGKHAYERATEGKAHKAFRKAKVLGKKALRDLSKMPKENKILLGAGLGLGAAGTAIGVSMHNKNKRDKNRVATIDEFAKMSKSERKEDLKKENKKDLIQNGIVGLGGIGAVCSVEPITSWHEKKVDQRIAEKYSKKLDKINEGIRKLKDITNSPEFRAKNGPGGVNKAREAIHRLSLRETHKLLKEQNLESIANIDRHLKAGTAALGTIGAAVVGMSVKGAIDAKRRAEKNSINRKLNIKEGKAKKAEKQAQEREELRQELLKEIKEKGEK